jgi:hypothetical protein
MTLNRNEEDFVHSVTNLTGKRLAVEIPQTAIDEYTLAIHLSFRW